MTPDERAQLDKQKRIARQPELAIEKREPLDGQGELFGASEGTARFRGRVDAVRRGVAFLSLADWRGGEVEIEWDAAELAGLGIGDGDLVTLDYRDGDPPTIAFGRAEPRPLPEAMRRDIAALLGRYRERGEWPGAVGGKPKGKAKGRKPKGGDACQS